MDCPWHNPENVPLTLEALSTLLSFSTNPVQQQPQPQIKSKKKLAAYQQAFVHASYQGEEPVSMERKPKVYIPLQKESNERLEFLGDAVIDLIVGEYLYDRYPDEDEGFLTQMRISLVNGKMLARLGRLLGLQRHVLLSAGQEHMRETDNVVEDTFEALVGAMYKDAGAAFAKRWFVSLLEENLDFTQLVTTSERDVFARLYRERFGADVKVSAVKLANGDFVVSLHDHETNALIGEGRGKTRRIASDMAARRGLETDSVGRTILPLFRGGAAP